MTDTNTGWRKRQIALDIKAENARELGLDYDPVHPTQRTWVGLTDEEMSFLFPHGKSAWVQKTVKIIEAKLKEKNT